MTLNEGIKQFRKKHIKPMTKQKKRKKKLIGFTHQDWYKTFKHCQFSTCTPILYEDKGLFPNVNVKVRITIEEL